MIKNSVFSRAQTKLTIIYTTLFFLFFWTLSISMYGWMYFSLSDSYISQVREMHRKIYSPGSAVPFSDIQTEIVTTAGTVALYQLRKILIGINLVLMIVVPVASWMYAGKTLEPLIQSHERQKQFVSDASHELRTPLSVLAGEIDVTLSKCRTVNEYRETVTSAREEIERMNNLVSNLLFLAKEEQKNLGFEPVDITDISGEAVASLQKEAALKKITIAFVPPEHCVEVYGNSTLLRQLVFNLVHNAISYTQEKGKVEVILKKNAKILSIIVVDTGPGIAKQEQERIFERFYRSDSSRTGRTGYGLGLAIAKKIVEIHNGTIAVSSVQHKGTTFTVQLPLRSTA